MMKQLSAEGLVEIMYCQIIVLNAWLSYQTFTLLTSVTNAWCHGTRAAALRCLLLSNRCLSNIYANKALFSSHTYIRQEDYEY